MQWLLRGISAIAWCGAIVTFIVYNYFVDLKGLHRVPCTAAEQVIKWRSTLYCATNEQAWVWNTNYRLLYIFLAIAVAVPITAGVLHKLFVNSGE